MGRDARVIKWPYGIAAEEAVETLYALRSWMQWCLGRILTLC